ncbi:MAG TPA: HAD family hydrolase [Candidatus Binataceae bacterium]|nr:HAD family hydrolase [Candidatus Binataceae bacterium]
MRAILFDFGGTLDFPRHWLDRFVSHYRAAGLVLDRVALDPAFDAATREAYAAGVALREYSLDALVDYLVAHQLDDLRRKGPPRIQELLENTVRNGGLGDMAGQIRAGFLAESAAGFALSRPLVASMSKRFKIAVVSNFYGNLDRILTESGLADSIDAVADSGRIGFHKPDPALFKAALTSLGVDAEEAVMVGDSLSKDCAPARALGMRTVWLRHRDSPVREAPANTTDFTIDRLEELKDLSWLSG